MQPWFDAQTAGTIGAIMGAGLGGGFGGIGGGVGGPLAAMGKAKTLVVGTFYAALIIAVLIAGVGIYALIDGQPWHVWFVFLMPGVTMAVIMGVLLPVIKSKYAQAEQRKLDADAIRSA